MAAKLKKGDKIVVISGRDKGKGGEIVKVLPDKVRGDRLLIRGINIQTHFVRADFASGQQGGIMKREVSIRASKVALADPMTGLRTRVGFGFVWRVNESTGATERIKVRISKRSGAEID